MQKKYIVRLTDTERQSAEEIVKRVKGTSQKVRRAQILLQSDADGPNWTDSQICLLYTSPSPRDATLSRMPSSA